MFFKIVIARSSSQSWMMCFIMYASPPEGTAGKKVAGCEFRVDRSQLSSARTCDHVRQVKQHTAHRWIRFENTCQQTSLSAGDINQCFNAGKVVSFDHCFGGQTRKTGHCAIEDVSPLPGSSRSNQRPRRREFGPRQICRFSHCEKSCPKLPSASLQPRRWSRRAVNSVHPNAVVRQ